VNSLPVRTRSGCAAQCAYCLTANLFGRHASGDVEAALAEVEGIAQEAEARGIGHVSVFFADDELNLPEERHALALLRGLEERGLHERIRWRGYFNPTPFSDELAALIVSTHGHASITVDSAAEPVLVRTQKPFRRRHLDRTIETLRRHSVSADLGLLFGLPGETEETLAETVAFVRSLPPEIEVVYSVGARVYPHTPLAAIAAAEPHLVIGGDGGRFFEPAVYASPASPRELARTLVEAFADLEHVSGVGVGFASGRPTIATAYRAVGDGRASARWREALALAEEPGDYSRSPAEALAALVQLAVWHGRFDLAAAAYKRLARQPVLPQGTTPNQIRVARLGCHVLAVLGRLGLRRRDVAEAAVWPNEKWELTSGKRR
jgi:pyruvate-formate lyase-activating enzyme